MKPTVLKTVDYLISTLSVAVLGVAAWRGAAKAGLLVFLIVGMAESVAGMALRWASYQLEAWREMRGLHP